MPLHQLLAVILASIFALLALVHFYWATGRAHDLGGAVPTRDGKPLFEPGPIATAAVGCALAAAAATVALRGGLWTPGLPPWVARVGIWALAVLFALRAIGEFRYVGFFKRVRDTRFARLDTLVFSPLCATIAILSIALALLAP
ncbi:MAG: DUF3995 domain-containing protein [Myxococcales bacterium]|nr:DUF3995 domain-containing protein [Myxococcales bacterium]